MARDPSDVLRQAMEFFIAGHIVEARALLLDLVRVNPQLEAGWMFLCFTLDEPQQKLDCLQQVLALNPNNDEARLRLQQLQGDTAAPPESSQSPDGAIHLGEEPAKKQRGKEGEQAPMTRPAITLAASAVRQADSISHRKTAEKSAFSSNIDSPTTPSAPHVSPFTVDISHMDDDLSGMRQADSAGGMGQAGYTSLSTSAMAAVPDAKKPPVAESEAISTAADKQGHDIYSTEKAKRGWGGTCGVFTVLALLIAVGVAIWAYASGNLPAALFGGTPIYSGSGTRISGTPVAWNLPVQWTVTPTLIPSLAPTATQTPTPETTPTLPTPDPAEMVEIVKMEQQVAQLRGLEWNGTLPIYIVDRTRAGNIMQELTAGEGDAETSKDESRVLVALGLIRPTFDWARFSMGRMADGVLGFYMPSQRTIYLIDTPFDIVKRRVFVHEFDHALVHQNYPSAGMLDQDRQCLADSQRCDAIRALVEGDATYMELHWFYEFASAEEKNNLALIPSSTMSPINQYTPPYAGPALWFAYEYGNQFVAALMNQGMWGSVNQAYLNLPLSTEQIMHPELYLAGEKPIAMSVPDLAAILGSAWRPIGSDTLGEFMTYLILGYGVDVTANTAPGDLETIRTEALTSAEGWGGDHLEAFYNENRNQTMMVVEWAWDWPKEKTEFALSLTNYLHSRFQQGRVERTGADCWRMGRDTTCLFQTTTKTLWVLAPDMDTINSIVAAYPGYQ